VSEFKVGEVAVFSPCGGHRQMTPEEQATSDRLAGTDVTIVAALGMHIERASVAVYGVVSCCGDIGYVAPCCLRKKRPPTWEDVEQVTGWRPEAVPAGRNGRCALPGLR
jgi:hypothetical protein